MLTLSRKPGEVILIGDNIRVEVVDIVRGRVRLGFTAPKDVAIMRQELLERLNRNQEGEQDSASNREAESGEHGQQQEDTPHRFSD